MKGERDMLKMKLKQTRIHLGLTQAKMAELIGVPLGTYKSWEYGTALPNYQARTLLTAKFPEMNMLWEREKMAK